MIIKGWFCSSGFGPGPSGSGLAIGVHGLAGPAMRKLKKTATAHITPNESERKRPFSWRESQLKANRYSPMIAPQKRIEPSSALQSETMVKTVGVERLPTWATYFTEKSWLSSAATITR